MTKDLEVVTPAVEVEKPTPKEGAKPTQPAVQEPTVGKLSQEDIDRGIGKGLESINRQYTQSKTEAAREKARADKLESNISRLQGSIDKLMEEKFEDDPSGFKSYMREQKIVEREAKIAEAEEDTRQGATAMHLFSVASELSEKTGVPFGELKNLPDEKSMMDKAIEHLKKPTSQSQEEPPPVIDPAVSSATGGTEWTMEQIREMAKTPKGLAEFQKNMTKILQASRDGKIR